MITFSNSNLFTGTKELLFPWFHTDGYIYDIIAAVCVLVINLYVALQAVQPLDRRAFARECLHEVYNLLSSRRYMVPNDPETSYPLVDETIDGNQLSVLMIVIPIGTFVTVAGVLRRLSDLHHALLSLLEGFALVTLFKRWMNLVGRYRPNFQAVEATNDSVEIYEGRQSYPSGHAAYMFLSMSITTLYLLGHCRALARPPSRGERFGRFTPAFLCLAPVVLAAFVAVTRPANYYHHYSDIDAGMFIGLATGAFAYLLNFESILDPIRSGHPKFRSVVPAWVVKERAQRRAELLGASTDAIAGAARAKPDPAPSPPSAAGPASVAASAGVAAPAPSTTMPVTAMVARYLDPASADAASPDPHRAVGPGYQLEHSYAC